MTFLFLSLENTHHTAKWHCLFSLAINLIIYFHKMRVSCWIFLNIKNNLCTFLYHQNRCLIIRVFNSISNIFDDFALVWVVQSSLLTSYVFKMIEGYGPHMCGSSWIEKLLPTIILHESKFSGVWGEGFFQVPEITLHFIFCLWFLWTQWCCVDQEEYESIIIGNESSKFRF